MLTHGQTRMALLALSALTCVFTCTAAAEDRKEDKNDASGVPTYRSAVSEVRVTFFAVDENNHPLERVSKSDFAVVDDERVIRNFRSLTHSDETSLDVVALVDMSESVAPRFRTAMREVLRLVAQEQSIADDNISVLSFGGTLAGTPRGTTDDIRPAVLCSSGCRTSVSVTRLQAVKSSGATPLYDALIFASDFISRHRRAGMRPVMILFSDGDDTISLHSPREALEAVRDTGALIYSIDIGTGENQASYRTSGSMFLRQASEATGGRYFSFSPRSSEEDGAARVLDAALEDLRASYVVTYDLPSHRAGFHSLRLLPTHNLNLTFRSRDGYDYKPSGQ